MKHKKVINLILRGNVKQKIFFYFCSLILLLLSCNLLNAESPYKFERTNGPYGGFVSSFCTDSNKTEIFANSYKIFKLNKKTNSWEQPFAALDTNYDRYYYISYADSVYLLSYVLGSGDDIWGNGLIRSTDKGLTWIEVNNFDYQILSIVNLDGILYAACKDTLMISTDYGASWNGCPIFLDSVQSYKRYYTQFDKIKTSGKEYLFLRTDDYGICRTSDFGKSWELITDSINKAFSGRNYYIALTVTPDNRLIIAASSGIYFSSDFGNSWQRQVTGIEQFSDYELYFLKSDNAGNIYGGGYGIGIITLMQKENSWKFLNKGLIPLSTQDLIIDETNGDMFVGTGDGINRSTDSGKNWFFYNDSINYPVTVQSVAFIKDIGLFAGTEGNGIYFSSNSGLLWTMCNIGLEDYDVTLVRSDYNGNLYLITFNNKLYKSADYGKTWNKININLTKGDFIGRRQIAIDSKNNIIIIYHKNNTTTDSLILSKDGGNIWQSINAPSRYIGAIAFDKIDNLFSANDTAIFRSTDYGTTWQKVFDNQKLADFNSFYFSKNNTIYIGTYKNGIFQSRDNGLSWTQLSNGINPTSNIVGICSPDREERIFAYGYNDYYVSNDTGLSWTNYEYSFPVHGFISQSFHDILYDGNSTLFAATDDGVYKIFNVLDDITEIFIDDKLIISPNPASDYLEISYSPSSNHRVNPMVDTDIVVYNVFGTKIPPRLTSSATPQKGNLQLDVSGLSPGFYFVRVGEMVGKFVKM